MASGTADSLISRTYGSAAGHPHNDYLRLLHDYGLVGMSLWALGLRLAPEAAPGGRGSDQPHAADRPLAQSERRASGPRRGVSLA